jgi:glycosyltransferase involved in cell wall biosynthesis
VDAILERERPDVIFSHDIHLNLAEAARYKAAHPECRVIMDYHADYSNSAKNWLSLNVLHKVIRRAFLRRYRKYLDGIYPIVPASATFLHEVYGIGYDEMELLPLAADTDLARAVAERQEGALVRTELGIPADATVIFTGGKLSPAKRTHVLVEALRSLEDERVHLLVVGDGGPGGEAYRQRLEELAAGSGRIHFTGWVDGDEVYRFMDACDFAIFPASQSVLWQQALSMGLPIIVGRVGVQDPAYMNPYGNVIILEEPDIRSEVIAVRIRELAGDPAHLATLQAAALRVSEELLNYDRLVPQTLGAGDRSRARRAS